MVRHHHSLCKYTALSISPIFSEILLIIYKHVYYSYSHAYDRHDEYRAWVKNVAPMENVMRESQQVIVLHKHDVQHLTICVCGL